ncbi:23S rRNA (adenine(2030)-N(6))-methyltransferase RlmJ [Castellaniella sp.]|uniref:23S rRNA (adenine(2030)-N(6))-methyltransferase RlmJ n=1 Tax=Castellaniella sp. TaxID=1955812 RepID=UPI003566A328
MFSYRHAFHAGNHGDVLKHTILVQILDYLKRKDTPFWVIDTHAGAGLYALDGPWARQSGEAAAGVARLRTRPNPPVLVQRYLQALQAFSDPPGRDTLYPGSPALAVRALRAHDHLHLFEWHPTEIDVLHQTLERLDADPRRVGIRHADGFAGLAALLPPPPRRGLILIDPSYEDKNDYRKVLNAVRAGLQRFAQGCYMIWYPLVQRVQATEMARALERLPVNWLHATLRVRKPSADGLGLHGSGVFVINPPYTLHGELRTALPWLAQTLAQDAQAGYALRSGTAPQKRSPGRK